MLQELLDDLLVLDLFQSSFCPSHWTILTDNLHRQLDQGKFLLLFLLDLTAVFNMVDYSLFTHCLVVAGLQGTALQWLISFLCGWRQMVALGEEMSTRHLLSSVLFQGAILSPMLLTFTCPLFQLIWSFGLGCH